MDSYLMNTQHINKVVSSLSWALHDTYNIRSRVDQDTAMIIIQALVLLKLDYCNSLLTGSP